MYSIEEKTDLNQISLTGTRAIATMGLLMAAPRSLEEIKEALVSYKLMDKSHSLDILRIDLNTLKYMGCNISRACKSTDYKYVLEDHPFSLKIDETDLKMLKRVYEQIKTVVDLETLLDYHDLFIKISEHIFNKDDKEAFLGISVLKNYDTKALRETLCDCEFEKILTILYTSASGDNPRKKEIIAKKLVIRNNKIYLYGTDTKKQQTVMLNYERIKQVISKKLCECPSGIKQVKVKFFLKEFGFDAIGEEETILEMSNDGMLIEGNYYNDFIAMQRILSFGSKCTVLEPEDFKNKIIGKLKEMRDLL